MDLSGFRSESHVAQQSRRHKLRVQQDYPNNLEHQGVPQGVPQDLIQVSNLGFSNTIPYSHPSVFPSEMLNYGDTPHPILAQELPATGQSGRMVPDGSGGYPRGSSELQNCGIWRTVDLESNFNYSSGLQGNESNRFMNNVSASGLYLKSGFHGYQDVAVTSTPSEVSSPKHYGEMQFGSTSAYHIPTASAAASGGRGCWTESGNELVLLPPTYGGQPNPAWPDELGLLASKSGGDRDQLRTVGRDCSTQSLSLSLCPVLPTKTNVGQFGADSMTGGGSKVVGDSNVCQVMMGSSTFSGRNTGPLGPFTGYATILKCSKFLKPAQQLLEEICSSNAPKPVNVYESPDKESCGTTSLREAIRAADSGGEGRGGGGDSGVSSSVAYGSNEISGDVGGRSSSGPEYQQKQAKLLFMQEEVCRRYKQYHQQMEMVVSSFESVAGLSAATPYISLALKTISRHFRCLKNAILDQLKHFRKALGEELLSPTGASSSKGEHSNTSRLKFIEHGFNTPKSSGGNVGFFEPQQHVWRPQRGLPERAVSVLRAWLFEHFLHPYPTDTDKHMLAAQTGLSRNQVSNWFINARVRVWKPMVEEIHMLETTGQAESNPNEPKTTPENVNPPNEGQTRNKYITTATSSNVSLVGRGEDNPEEWNQEKRSKVECQIPDSMDGSLMGFMPYQRSGLGAVSLTLGLRQSPDGTQQQQQLQQQEHQLRQHFGGQMIHDFVG